MVQENSSLYAKLLLFIGKSYVFMKLENKINKHLSSIRFIVSFVNDRFSHSCDIFLSFILSLL